VRLGVAVVPAFLDGGQGGRGRVEPGRRAVDVVVLVGHHGLAVVARRGIVVDVVCGRGGAGGMGVGRGG
jgi:hypothetical protein